MIQLAIVDDHKMFRKGLIGILQKNEAFKILFEASSGTEFFTFVDSGLLPDIVLLDLNMPGMNGFQTQKLISENHPSIKTLVLSMDDEIDHVGYLFELDINGYILKDADPEVLEEAIFTIHREDHYLDKFATTAIQQRLKSRNRTIPRWIPDGITERELQVLLLLCDEKSTKEIATELFLSPRTIEDHRKSLFEKTSTKNLAGLLKYAIRKNLVQVRPDGIQGERA